MGSGEEQPNSGETVIKTPKEIVGGRGGGGVFTRQLRPQNKTIQGIPKSHP